MPEPFLLIGKTRKKNVESISIGRLEHQPIVRTTSINRPDHEQIVESNTIQRPGQKPIDITIPINRQGQKQVVEKYLIGISKHEPIVRTNSIQETSGLYTEKAMLYCE